MLQINQSRKLAFGNTLRLSFYVCICPAFLHYNALLQLKYFFVFQKKVADFLYLTLPKFLGRGTAQRTNAVHSIHQSATHCLSLGYLVGCCEIWLNDCVGAVIVDYHLILLTKNE